MLDGWYQQLLSMPIDVAFDDTHHPSMGMPFALPALRLVKAENGDAFAGPRFLPIDPMRHVICNLYPVVGLFATWIPFDQEINVLFVGADAVLDRIVPPIQAHQQWRWREPFGCRKHVIQDKTKTELAAFTARLEPRCQAPTFVAQVAAMTPYPSTPCRCS